MFFYKAGPLYVYFSEQSWQKYANYKDILKYEDVLCAYLLSQNAQTLCYSISKSRTRSNKTIVLAITFFVL